MKAVVRRGGNIEKYGVRSYKEGTCAGKGIGRERVTE